MTIDNVLTYAGPTTASVFAGWGAVVGIATIIILVGAWLFNDNFSGGTAFIGAGLAATAAIGGLFLANGINANNGVPTRTEATIAWLEQEHGLFMVAGSAEGKDADDGLMDYRIVVAMDADNNLHTIQLRKLEDSMVGMVNGERVLAGEGYYLADPETGEEFTLGTTD